MMTDVIRLFKRSMAFLLCFILMSALFLPLTCCAQEDGKTVRVGWYESAFHHSDQFGRRSGYGYEYQTAFRLRL